MAEFPALPLLTDAYIADTQHLTNEEHGVYLRLLMFAWRTRECGLPDDDKRLALMVGVTPSKWAKLKPVVMEFWTLRDGVWRQKKLTKQRAFVEKQREQKSAAGKASAEARALKSNEAEPTAVATAEPTAPQQSKTISNTEKKEREPIGSPKQKRACSLPDGWVPSAKNRADAYAKDFTDQEIDHEADKFRDYHLAKGTRFKNWDAGWRTWITNAREFRGRVVAIPSGSRGHGQGGSLASIVARRRASG